VERAQQGSGQGPAHPRAHPMESRTTDGPPQEWTRPGSALRRRGPGWDGCPVRGCETGRSGRRGDRDDERWGGGYGRSVGGPRWGFAQAVAIVPAGRRAGPCSLPSFTLTPHFTNFQRAAHGTPTSLSREPAKKRAMADPVHTALPRGAMQRGVSSLGTGAVEHQEKGRMLVQLTTLTLKVYQSDFPTLTL